MIKIFLPKGVEDLDRRYYFAAEKGASGFDVTAFGVETKSLKGSLVLAAGDSKLTIPDVLVADSVKDTKLPDGEMRLLSGEEAMAKAKALAASALHKLHDDLRNVAIKTDGSTSDGFTADFFGITGIAAAAKTSFHLEINPPGLLPGLEAPQLFRAQAEAEFKGGFKSPFVSVAVDAVVRINVELSRDDVLDLFPRIDIPELPHFSLVFPKIDLPKWSLDELPFSHPDLKFFRLPFQEQLKLSVVWTPTLELEFKIEGGKLQLRTKTSSQARVLLGEKEEDKQEILKAEGVELEVKGSEVAVRASDIVVKTVTKTFPSIDLTKDFPGPFIVILSDVKIDVKLSGTGPIKVELSLTIGRVLIQARTDPKLVLALSAKFDLIFDNGKLDPKLRELKIVEPYPIELALIAAHVIADGARRLLSFIQRIDVPDLNAPGTPDLPSMEGFLAVLRRIGALVAAAAAWLVEQGVAAVRKLAGLAEAALKFIADGIAALAKAIAKAGAAVAKYIVVEIRVDPDHWEIVQIVVTPSDPGASIEAFNKTILGVTLDVPFALTPAVICDLQKGWIALTLQAHNAASGKVSLSTDLWLENKKSGVTEPVSGSAKGGPGDNNSPAPLLLLTAEPQKPPFAVALIFIDNGTAKFFQTLKTEPIKNPILAPNDKVVVPAGNVLIAAQITSVEPFKGDHFKVDAHVDTERILSLFRAPKPKGDPKDDWTKQFEQHIKITKKETADFKPPIIKIPLGVEIKISDAIVETALTIEINLDKLSMSIDGGRFDIEIDTEKQEPFSLLGLNGKFVPKKSNGSKKNGSKKKESEKLKALFIDLSDGDPRLGLHQDARLDLSYNKLSNSGRGLQFSVDELLVARDGIDLDARVKDDPVTLAGVDMPFRFDKGQLSIKRSQIRSFALAGHGNLPPALVGEAKATIELNFVQQDGRLALQAAKAVLDKSADPLRCESTQFTITVTKLGLKFVEEGGYHFYFTLTGSAEFRPSSNAFSNGLLKNLSSLRIVLDEAPLASDPSVLLNHIEFQVTVEPPKRSSFFDLFSFELRGVGFHPAAKEFGGSPAFSISGQVNFTNFGDVVTPRFDFHKLWIAPPEAGKSLPRIRCDGLGVGLSLGSMAEVSATAIAVDGTLPTMFKPDVLPANVTAQGFLASGSLRIKGWASMSAAMGFLELEREEGGVTDKRPAFFLYIQKNDMSEKIPTPIGTIFLREVGFGFGHRFTLAGIAAADRAETPRELVKVLDEISKYQGSLHDIRAWSPTFENAAMTLALRGLFSLTSVSSSTEFNEKGEKELPNFVLFDIVAALRTDLTFLLNVRAWVAYNYADWRKARTENLAWPSNPGLTGYMYLSVPRREFLARAVYNPGAEVGEHPKLPEGLKKAMKAVRWSSTLYIRPGLFHMEFGWPYELGFTIGNSGDRFFLNIEGGGVLRFEDSSTLYGLAFRARGHILFAFSTGGDFGAAISARADFVLGAKLIAYVSTNISETMFYGVITLDITVKFTVRMWLKTKWFSLSVGFSRSITIHVGVELLVEPDGIAAQIKASVAVSAFGRTLSLGIGFTLGSKGRLANARARVERFLSLGLGSSYPDPTVGVPVSRPPPLPEPSRQSNAKKSDERIEDSLERRDSTGRPSDDAPSKAHPVDIVGVDFADTHYWALLFPIPAANAEKPEPHYLVQLIPQDNNPLDKNKAAEKRSHFYSAPIAKDASVPKDKPLPPNAHAYVVEGIVDGEWLGRDGTAKSGSNIYSAWDAPFGLHGDGEEATDRPDLKTAFKVGCFMAAREAAPPLEATDVESVPWADPTNLPEDQEAANIVLAAAARSRADVGAMFARMQQVEEARSCFIATIADCAEKLTLLVSFNGEGKAQLDTDADKKAMELEFDPRALGLTFVLSAQRLNALFKMTDQNQLQEQPLVSGDFAIRTRIPVSTGDSFCGKTGVLLFNPPLRMFRVASPVLKDLSITRRATGVLLQWDLEPAWGRSDSVYEDPEFHLKHYRIERRIEGLKPNGLGRANPALQQFTIKPADNIEIVITGDKKAEKRRIRSRLQFVDDLQDVAERIRSELLPPALLAERGKATADFITANTKIIYTIVPVDCAGTAGVADQFAESIKAAKDTQPGVLKAIVRFHYPKVPSLHAWTPTNDFLHFTFEEEESDPPPKVVDKDRKHDHTDYPPAHRSATDYALRVRTERTVAAGVFGADALSQARSEPPVPDRADSRGANEIEITLALPKGDPTAKKVKVTRVARCLKPATGTTVLENEGKPQEYEVSKKDWDELLEALDIPVAGTKRLARVAAARLYIRPKPVGLGPEEQDLSPEWCPVQLQLRIVARDDPQEKPAGADKGGSEGNAQKFAVDTTIERFEHPVDVHFRPLTSKNIVATSGRLHLYYPKPKSTFSQFAELSEATVDPLCDGDQRTGIKLAWNARPADIKAVAPGGAPDLDGPDLHSLIAGYDLFSLDTTAVPKNADTLRFAQPLGRVQRLPAAERGLEPSETGDFARVEVLYPSETQRLTQPRFGRRRRIWYSPAESFLIWPKRVLRRSVLPLPDETDIAMLFAKKRPAQIRIEWEKPDDDTPKWPADAGQPPKFGLASDTGGAKPSELKNGIVKVEDKDSIELVRNLLRRLVVFEVDQHADEIADKDPLAFSNLAIKLTPLDKGGEEVKGDQDLPNSVLVKLSLAPPIHPILADVLDVIQYETDSGHSYRRYEPVLEPAPPVNAEGLAGFLDETAPDRDPAGWGVLRTLGLAAAFRLYDVEEGRFLPAHAALTELNRALKQVLPRYSDVPGAKGAPFVDVMFTTDGLSELVSHHGAAPLRGNPAKDLRDNNALALVQIELRPTVQPLLSQPDDGAHAMARCVVRYATVKRKAEFREEITLKAAQPTGNGKVPTPVLIEIDTLAPIKGDGPRRVLLMQGAISISGRPITFPVGGGEVINDAVTFEKQNNESDSSLAFVRFTALETNLADISLASLFDEKSRNNIEVEARDDLAPHDDLAGPWGRFASLPDRWLAALLFGDGVANAPENPQKPEKVDAVVGDTLNTLTRILGRPGSTKGAKFAEISADPQKRLELAARLGPWTRRFMEHGPAAKLEDGVGLAFGMLTRPDPWRLAPDKDGRLSLILLEKDRWGKTRKYAVRPFGRYENLVLAAAVHDEAEKKTGGGLVPLSFSDSVVNPAAALTGNFADAVIERTEPLAAPVILATRRKDNLVDSNTRRPGRTNQIVVSRHPEEILSDANIRVDGGIAMRHVAVGFWREFAAPKWAEMVRETAKLDPIDLLAEFGPFKDSGRNYARLGAPRGLSIVKKEGGIDDIDMGDIRDLYEQHPDLWRGAYVFNLADLPYGFRLHATAHAAAGVVVSPSTIATVDEAGYGLSFPWTGGRDDALSWQDKKVPEPRWSIVRPEDETQLVGIRVKWPLVRLVDSLLLDARTIWLGSEDAPPLYRLPDPAVSYRLSTGTTDGRVRVGEVEIGAISNDSNDPRKALYLTQLIGPRFVGPVLTGPHKPDPLANPLTHVELTLDMALKEETAETGPELAGFAPAALAPPSKTADLSFAPDLMALWGEMAPEPAGGVLVLTIVPPSGANAPPAKWKAFKKNVDAFLVKINTYATGSAPERLKAVIADVDRAVRKYAVDSFKLWEGKKDEKKKIALPTDVEARWMLGLPAEGVDEIQVADPKVGWIWHSNPSEDATKKSARKRVDAAFQTAIDAAKNAGLGDRVARLEALRAVVLDAMRARAAARRRFTDEKFAHKLLPRQRTTPPDSPDSLLDIEPGAPADLVVEVSLPANGRTRTLVEDAFDALDEIPNAADTLDGLLSLMKRPEKAAQVNMRWSARKQVEPELEKLLQGGQKLARKITAMIMRKPMTYAEILQKFSAHNVLKKLAKELTVEMVFGPDRQLVIQAFHGLAAPIDYKIEQEGVGP